MTRSPACTAVVLTIVCVDDDLRSFCRHVSGLVARSSWTLTRAFAVARQVHPHHPDALGALATLMHCEFRPVDAGTPVSDHDEAELLRRLSVLETFGMRRLTEPADFGPVPMPS